MLNPELKHNKTPLNERIAQTVDGQATWADLGCDRKCGDCRHFPRRKTNLKPGEHEKRVCLKTKALLKKNSGIPAIPDNARACTYFEARS